MRPSFCAECNGDLDPYLPDCPHCGAHIDEGEFAHHDSDLELSRTDPQAPPTARRRWRLHFPWGLLVLLALDAGGSYAYLQYRQTHSPEYQAATHLAVAARILGSDHGDTATPAQLEVAYASLLDALTLYPDDRGAHEQLEEVEWALVRQNRKVPQDLKRRAAFLGAQWQQIQEGHSSMFEQGARERWDLDSVLDAPRDISRYAVLGGAGLILLWLYKEMQDHKFTLGRDDEKEIDRREELKELHSHRRR